MASIMKTVRLLASAVISPRTVNGAHYKKVFVPMVFIQQSSKSTMAASNSHVVPLSSSLDLRICNDNNVQRHDQIAIIFSWLTAKRRHINKYADFYHKQGFDVLSILSTPKHLMWPATGSHVIVGDLLKFLMENENYKSIIVHGFSVGAYLYGEMLFRMKEQHEVYNTLRDRIIGQIFDSAVDVYGLPTGTPKALTKVVWLQKLMEAYFKFHMRMFNEVATKHYLKASEAFHNAPVHAPSLFLFSKDDPVGTSEGNLRVIRKWEAMGFPVYAKCWDSSPHVGHLRKHPDEYLEELSRFFDRLGKLAEPHRRVSKIQN